MTDDIIQKIIYYFGDAPVPPEYHRSYKIIVTANKVTVIVDSYGDVLANKEYEITNEQFNDIRVSLKRNEIRNCSLDTDESCTGGTSESISCSDGENEIFSGLVYHCGGENIGNLCGDLNSFANDVKNLVPTLEKLLQ